MEVKEEEEEGEMGLDDDVYHVYNTFRMDSCSRDCYIEKEKHISWATLNGYLRNEVGHPLSRWFLLLDLDMYKTLHLSLDIIETLRHQVLMSEAYISKDFGKQI